MLIKRIMTALAMMFICVSLYGQRPIRGSNLLYFDQRPTTYVPTAKGSHWGWDLTNRKMYIYADWDDDGTFTWEEVSLGDTGDAFQIQTIVFSPVEGVVDTITTSVESTAYYNIYRNGVLQSNPINGHPYPDVTWSGTTLIANKRDWKITDVITIEYFQ